MKNQRNASFLNGLWLWQYDDHENIRKQEKEKVWQAKGWAGKAGRSDGLQTGEDLKNIGVKTELTPASNQFMCHL